MRKSTRPNLLVHFFAVLNLGLAIHEFRCLPRNVWLQVQGEEDEHGRNLQFSYAMLTRHH